MRKFILKSLLVQCLIILSGQILFAKQLQSFHTSEAAGKVELQTSNFLKHLVPLHESVSHSGTIKSQIFAEFFESTEEEDDRTNGVKKQTNISVGFAHILFAHTREFLDSVFIKDIPYLISAQSCRFILFQVFRL